MASYFDEHDCEPTNAEEQYRQNALLELARWSSWSHLRLSVRLQVDSVQLWLTAGLCSGLWCRAWTCWTRARSTSRTGTSDFLLRLPKLQFRLWLWSSFLQNKQVTTFSQNSSVCFTIRAVFFTHVQQMLRKKLMMAERENQLTDI